MKYLDEVRLHIGDVETKTIREIKQICTTCIWDNEQWESNVNNKSTLIVYRHHKKQIQEEHIYNLGKPLIELIIGHYLLN